MATLNTGVLQFGFCANNAFVCSGSVLDAAGTKVFILDASGGYKSWASGRASFLNNLSGNNKDQIPSNAGFLILPGSTIITDDTKLSFGTPVAGISPKPVVTLSAPTTGIANQSVVLSPTVSIMGDTIAKVEFFEGTTLIGASTTPPYSFSWTPLASGNFSITAKATGVLGGSTISAPKTINVSVDAVADYSTTKLPNLDKKRVSVAATEISSILTNVTANQVIDIIAKGTRWFLFEPDFCYSDTAATNKLTNYNQSVKAIKDCLGGQNATYSSSANQNPGYGLPKLVGDGVYFPFDGTGSWYDFDGSFLAGQPFTVISLAYFQDFAPTVLDLLGGTFKLGYSNRTTMRADFGGTLVSGATTNVPLERNLHFLVASSTGTGKSLFKDDSSVGSSADTSTLATYSNATIGSSWHGAISDIFIASPALSSQEIDIVKRFIAIYRESHRYGYTKYETLPLQVKQDKFSYDMFPIANKGVSSNNDVYLCTQYQSDALSVDSVNGLIYSATYWDESKKGASYVLSTGKTNGIITSNGRAITHNSTHIFGVAIEASGTTYNYSFKRFNKIRNEGLYYGEAPFSNGSASVVAYSTTEADLNVAIYDKAINGIAATDTELYVGDSVSNKVKIYNTSTGDFLREFDCIEPRKFRLDGSGNLWVIRENTVSTRKVTLFNPATGSVIKEVTEIIDPLAIAIDNAGRLLIADGADKKIKIYDVSATPALVATFGSGYVYALDRPVQSHGKMAPLFFREIADIACDNAGNVIIADSSFNIGLVLQSYKLTDGSLNWETNGLLFIETASLSPTSETEVYSRNHKFSLNYKSKKWKYEAYTLDKSRYPSDLRLENNAEIPDFRFISGIKYMFMCGFRKTAVFRSSPATSGEAWIPAVEVNFTDKTYWRDSNANGVKDIGETNAFTSPLLNQNIFVSAAVVDPAGNILYINANPPFFLEKIEVAAIGSSGVPTYDIAAIKSIAIPDGHNLQNVQRIYCDPQSGQIVLAGYTVGATVDSQSIGDKILVYRYDGSSLVLRDTYQSGINLVDQVNPFQPISLSLVDDYLFIGYIKNDTYFRPDDRPQLRVIDLHTKQEVADLSYLPVGRNGSYFDIGVAFTAFRSKQFPNQYRLIWEDVAFNLNRVLTLDFVERIGAFSPDQFGITNWWTPRLNFSDTSGLSLADQVSNIPLSATGTQAPTINASGLNGKPTIVFDGVDDNLVTSALNRSQPAFVLIVFRILTGAEGYFGIFDLSQALWVDSFQDPTNYTVRVFTNVPAGNGYSIQTGLVLNQWNICAFSITPTATSFWKNGTKSTQPGQLGTSSITRLFLGGRAGTAFSKIEVAEVMLGTSVSDEDVAALGTKMAEIYNLSWT